MTHPIKKLSANPFRDVLDLLALSLRWFGTGGENGSIAVAAGIDAANVAWFWETRRKNDPTRTVPGSEREQAREAFQGFIIQLTHCCSKVAYRISTPPRDVLELLDPVGKALDDIHTGAASLAGQLEFGGTLFGTFLSTLRVVHVWAASYDDWLGRNPGPAPKKTSKKDGKPGRERQKEIVQTIIEEGDPMTQAEIQEAWRMVNPGKLPANLSWMVREGLLVKTGDGYWPAGLPVPGDRAA